MSLGWSLLPPGDRWNHDTAGLERYAAVKFPAITGRTNEDSTPVYIQRSKSIVAAIVVFTTEEYRLRLPFSEQERMLVNYTHFNKTT
jgi:hypothetical protein